MEILLTCRPGRKEGVDVIKMTNHTKSYLFAAVSSAFFLFLALPAVTDPSSPSWLPTQIAVIGALSLLSISAGGLASEAYDIARKKNSVIESCRSCPKKYLLALVSSILFLAVVAPSMQLYVEKWGIAGIATVIVLLVLSIAIAGLVSEGILSFAKIQPITITNRQTSDKANLWASTSTLSPKQSVTIDYILSHIDSRFKDFDASQERMIRELKLQLVNELEGNHDHPIDPSATLISNPRATKESSQKDQIVDTLLGKAGVGGAK